VSSARAHWAAELLSYREQAKQAADASTLVADLRLSVQRLSAELEVAEEERQFWAEQARKCTQGFGLQPGGGPKTGTEASLSLKENRRGSHGKASAFAAAAATEQAQRCAQDLEKLSAAAEAAAAALRSAERENAELRAALNTKKMPELYAADAWVLYDASKGSSLSTSKPDAEFLPKALVDEVKDREAAVRRVEAELRRAPRQSVSAGQLTATLEAEVAALRAARTAADEVGVKGA